ncbi:hypothetical protein DPMN_165820 [Dreissena polymorpha]|uniref:Uncharacterized protein n=1 Tax=Dreissena polymorpha TaxID=45954 RepID=A0A9D4EYB7_DREPO|nr:hypothetical protein DPMN_165820 [Dreissena polymorpha]
MKCSDTTAKQFCKEPNIQFAKRIRFVNQTSLVLLGYNTISCVQLSKKGTDLLIVGELWHIDTTVAGVIDISDVVVGDGGCMYVSGSKSNNVKLLKTNGKWGIRSTIYFNMQPTSVSLNNSKQKIIVSCDDNTVRVFAEK